MTTDNSRREQLFGAIARSEWSIALSLLHGLPERDEPIGKNAAGHLAEGLVDGRLSADEADLEKALLMEHTGMLPLSCAQADAIAEELVARFADNAPAAVRAARLRPDNAACAAVLSRFGEAERRQDGDLSTGRIETVRVSASADARRSIFRSAQERELFRAASRVFPGMMLVPNAALHALIDYDGIKGLLDGHERELFFRALIDLAVIDPGDGYRVRYLFELDSPVHDDAVRAARDRQKDRLAAVSGCVLIRLRTAGASDLHTLVALLEEATRAR